jgi:hypothetical protein
LQVDREAVGSVCPGGCDVFDAGDQDHVRGGVGRDQRPGFAEHDGLALARRRLLRRLARLVRLLARLVRLLARLARLLVRGR